MNKSEFIIWLYEEKDKLDEALHKDHVNGTYRDECWAKVNLLDKIIVKAKLVVIIKKKKIKIMKK